MAKVNLRIRWPTQSFTSISPDYTHDACCECKRLSTTVTDGTGKNVSMKRIHVVLLIVGGSWLALALWVVFSSLILRETRLGVVAQLLDKLPPVVGTPIFILLWAILLLGW